MKNQCYKYKSQRPSMFQSPYIFNFDFHNRNCGTLAMATDPLSAMDLHSTSHYLGYSFNAKEHQHPFRRRRRPCTLVSAALPNGLEFQIPCFSGHHSDIQAKLRYLQHYEKSLVDKLFFAGVPRCCAEEIANAFTIVIVRPAASTHLCPLRLRSGPIFNTVYLCVIEIDPYDDLIEEEDIPLEEEFGPRPKPAAVESVQELVAVKLLEECKKRGECEDGWSSTDCVICSDEIETRRSSLAMDCSHVFHEDCLVRWLKTGHSCPLCRYPMPTDDD